MSKDMKGNKELVDDLHYLSTYQKVAKATAHQEMKQEQAKAVQLKKKSLLEKVRRQLEFEKKIRDEEEDERKAKELTKLEEMMEKQRKDARLEAFEKERKEKEKRK